MGVEKALYPTKEDGSGKGGKGSGKATDEGVLYATGVLSRIDFADILTTESRACT